VKNEVAGKSVERIPGKFPVRREKERKTASKVDENASVAVTRMVESLRPEADSKKAIPGSGAGWR